MFERISQFFSRAFRREAPPPRAAPAPQEATDAILQRQEAEDRLRSKKDRPKYSEARAREVLESIRGVSADHPLYNLTFTQQTLINNPAMANTLAEMAKIPIDNRPETVGYLLKKVKEVSQFRRDLQGKQRAQGDRTSLGTLQTNIERRIREIAADQRVAVTDNDIARAERIPDARNRPPGSELTAAEKAAIDAERARFDRPKEDYIPLDFSGNYSPLAHNAPDVIKNLVADIKAHEADYRDDTVASVEHTRYGDRNVTNGENALKDLQLRINAMAADPNISYRDIWPYMRAIHKQMEKLAGGRQFKQLEDSEYQALERAGKMENKARRSVVYEQVFYKLLYRVLRDPYQQWTKTFGLYETEAMNEFYDKISEFEGGYTEVNRLTNKMYGIFAAHDAIVICQHPEGNEEAYKALTTFARNSFTMDTMEDPVAEQLINIYERVLWDILRTFDGRLPPDWVEPTAGGNPSGDSKWDDMVKERFFQMVDAGVVFDAKRDPLTGKVMKDAKGMIIWDRENPVKRSWFDGDGRWRLLAAMQQAKGFGLLDSRLLEIFGLQRTPSFTPEIQPDWTDSEKVFSSVPYEGMARYINPVHLFTKWRMAEDRFKSYWNLIVWAGDEDHERKWKEGKFDLDEPKKVFQSMENGTFLEDYGEVAQRFLEKYNYGRFSGRFGPWTGWGVRDSIIGMSDKEREYLGGSIRAAYMNKVWAEEDVKEFLVEREYKEKFKEELMVSGKMMYLPNGHPDEEWFEKEWRRIGKQVDPRKGIYTNEVRNKWGETKKKVEPLTNELISIYNAMTWVQMACRSPHIIARHTHVYEQYMGKLRKRSLREKILEEMFPNLDLEQFFHTGANPKPDHERWFRENIAVLEGDIDIVAHAALYDAAGPRNIRSVRGTNDPNLDDFQRIKAYNPDGTVNEAESISRREKAREYFRKANLAITGGWSEREWMDHLGLRYVGPNEQMLSVNWDNLWDQKTGTLKMYGAKKDMTYLDYVLSQAKTAADLRSDAKPYYQFDRAHVIDAKQQNLMSTEDVVWNRMEMINLGYRHWARRGGDFEGHAKGLKAEVSYVVHNLRMNANMETILKSFHEIADAYEEDDRYFSDLVIGMHAQATAKLFKQPWQFSKTGIAGKVAALFTESSIAQKIAGRTAATWDSNKMFEFAHTLGMENLLPWKPETWLGEGPWAYSVEQLEEDIGGTRLHALYEVLTLAAFMVFAMTVYKALTAKSEEEESH